MTKIPLQTMIPLMVVALVFIVGCTQNQSGQVSSSTDTINTQNVQATDSVPAVPVINNSPSQPATQVTQSSQQQHAKAPAQQQTPNPGKTYTIAIQNFAFSPVSLTIHKGDSVVWTNFDTAPHTVTSDTGTELNSDKLSKGQTYAHTFTAVGTYTYHCAVHTMMTATIIVQ